MTQIRKISNKGMGNFLSSPAKLTSIQNHLIPLHKSAYLRNLRLNPMLILHSTFDLTTAASEFKQAFDAFGVHLRDQDLIISWRFQQRHPHPGYDSTPPENPYYVSMEFRDIEQAEACWSHIEGSHCARGGDSS